MRVWYFPKTKCQIPRHSLWTINFISTVTPRKFLENIWLWKFFWLLSWFTDWYDWLIDWLVDWLINWLIDWLVGWLVGWLVANLLYGWWSMVGRLGNFWEFSTYKILWIFFLIDRCLIQLNFWLSDWLIDWLIGCLVIPLRIWIGIYGWETHKILRTPDLQNLWHFLCIEC